MSQLAIETILQNSGINYRLIKLAENAFTVEDVMKHSDGSLKAEEVCKTIILHGKKSDKSIAIFLKGEDKIDFKAAKILFGEEMSIATPEQVMKAAEVEPGAVCPFILSVPLYVDERVTKLTQVNCGSGHHLFGLEFQFKDLEKIKPYKIVQIAKTTV